MGEFYISIAVLGLQMCHDVEKIIRAFSMALRMLVLGAIHSSAHNLKNQKTWVSELFSDNVAADKDAIDGSYRNVFLADA